MNTQTTVDADDGWGSFGVIPSPALYEPVLPPGTFTFTIQSDVCSESLICYDAEDREVLNVCQMPDKTWNVRQSIMLMRLAAGDPRANSLVAAISAAVVAAYDKGATDGRTLGAATVAFAEDRRR